MTIPNELAADRRVLELLNSANDLLMKDSVNDAVKCYIQALEINGPHPYLYAKKGYAEFLVKEYLLAINSFNEAMKLKSNAPSTLFYRALAKENVGDIDGALSDYEESARLDDTDVEVFCSIGLLYEYKKDYISAKFAYERALNIEPENFVAMEGIKGIEQRTG
jgi:tetratricopeptide (TPR) repeat protein